MKKLYIILYMMIILCSFAYADMSANRLDYYKNNTVYLTDGLTADDYGLDGNAGILGAGITSTKWSYANTEPKYGGVPFIGSIALNIANASSQAIIDVRNASFTGIWSASFMVFDTVATGFDVRLNFINDDATNFYRFDNGGGFLRATYRAGGVDTEQSACSNFPLEKWFNLTINYTNPANVKMYVNGTICVTATTATHDLRQIQLRNGNDGVANTYYYMDKMWVSNNERPEGGATSPIFSANKTNATSTSPVKDGSIQLNITATDDIDIDTVKLATNISGTLINISSQIFSDLTDTSITAIFNYTVGNKGLISYQYWSNNSNSLTVVSNVMTFTVQNTPPVTPVVTSPYNTEINNTRHINFYSYDNDNDTINYSIYINNTLNITTITNITVWNGSDGYYSLKISSFDGIKSSSNSSEIFFTLDTTAPAITLISINQTYNETYKDNIWINFTIAESSNCSVNSTYWNYTTVFSTGFNWYESTAPSDFYSLRILCYDIAGNSNVLDFYFSKDTVNPTISGQYPNDDNSTSIYNTGSFTLNITFTDNLDLYDYNITINMTNGTSMFTANGLISGTSYKYSSSVTTSTWVNDSFYNIFATVCDSHTDLTVSLANDIVQTDKEINFKFDDADFTITSISGNEFNNNYQKLKDKYTFSFSYSKELKEKVFLLTSPQDITYLPNSKYKGHFVVGHKWIDFENNGEVEVKEILKNQYEITVYNPSNILLFNSIGELNCFSTSYKFYLSKTIISTNESLYSNALLSHTNWFNQEATDTSTLAGVVMIFFLFFVWICMVAITEYSRIPVIGLITAIYGFFLSWLFFTIISAILGVVLAVLNLIYLMRSVMLVQR